MKKVMVFAPHPDDEVIGVGGTLAKMCRPCGVIYNPVEEDVWDAEVVIITDGRHSPCNDKYTEDEMWRLGFEESYAVSYEVSYNIGHLNFEKIEKHKDRHKDTSAILLDRLFGIFDNTRPKPDEVYLPHLNDNHPTHNKVTDLVITAAILADCDMCDFWGYEVWSPIQEQDERNIKKIEIDFDRRMELVNMYKSRMEFTDFADTLGLFTWRKEAEINPDTKPFEAFVYMDPLYIKKSEWKEKIKKCYS